MARKVHFIGWAIGLLLLDAGRAGSAADFALGTVFYSPSERAALMTYRHGSSGEEKVEAGPVESEAQREEAAPKTLPYTVSGIVSRSEGKSVFWLNGQPVAEGPPNPSLPDIRLARDHAVINGKVVKVGETLDTISGERISSLPAGAVKISP